MNDIMIAIYFCMMGVDQGAVPAVVRASGALVASGMGPENAATVMACILERGGHINSAGGYLRDLTRRTSEGDADEAYLKKAAKLVLGFTDEQLDAEVDAGRMLEVRCDDQNL